MQIHLISVGNKMPKWIQDGYQEYAKRLPKECELILREVPPLKRTKNADLTKIREEEGTRALSLLSKDDHIIGLELRGKPWSTLDLADNLNSWQNNGKRVVLLVGGPEGLSQACISAAQELWSLSNLTLPHPVVRVVIAVQIYRAWSILNNHPYHR